jgi:hypothetical protein
MGPRPGVPTAKRGRGVASEVALARRDSPARGGRHLGLAKALVREMPHTPATLERGALSEWRATLIARESACLSVEDRRALDAELCADVSKLAGTAWTARVGVAPGLQSYPVCGAYALQRRFRPAGARGWQRESALLGNTYARNPTTPTERDGGALCLNPVQWRPLRLH